MSPCVNAGLVSVAWIVLAAPLAADAQPLTATGVGATVPADDFPMYRRVGAELSQDANGVFAFDGYGHRPDDGWDMIGFAYRRATAGDFAFSVRLVDVPDCAYLNIGLMVREGLVGHERMVFFNYNGNADAWRFYTRHTPGNDGGRNCPGGYRQCQSRVTVPRFADPFDVYLRLERQDGRYRAAHSLDGENYTSVADGHAFDLPADEVYVGVAMSCGNKGAARGVAHFDHLQFEGVPAAIPSDAGIVDPPAPDAAAPGLDAADPAPPDRAALDGGVGWGPEAGSGSPPEAPSAEDGGATGAVSLDAGEVAQLPTARASGDGVRGGCRNTAGRPSPWLFGLGVWLWWTRRRPWFTGRSGRYRVEPTFRR